MFGSIRPSGSPCFGEAYSLTGYELPSQGADEVALYDHALGFLDLFIEEASERGLKLRHRLDAQSVVWAICRKSDETHDPPQPPQPPEPPEPARLALLSEKVSLPVAFLEEVELLLEDKRQVIFQGPPGTGKTFVAQELAQCLAGSGRRVTLVQFPPLVRVRGLRPGLPSGVD